MFQRKLSILVIPLILSFSFASGAQEYCMAIRGNGELAPAHWGAVANVIERLGLPKMQAGGSSASVTMFLLDAIASNKHVQTASAEQRNQRAAFLVKSLEGFADYLASTRRFAEFKALYGNLTRLSQTDSLQTLKKGLDELLNSPAPGAVLSQRYADYMTLIDSALKIGLLNAKTVGGIQASLETAMKASSADEMNLEIRRARFLVTEVLESVRVFGEFDAATDANLFFRPGVVDFDVLAVQAGRIGQFYSGRAANSGEDTLWENLLNRCAAQSAGQQWPQISAGCHERFDRLVNGHFTRQVEGNFGAELVGQTIKSFPTTAVISGRGADDIAGAFKMYAESLNPQFGLNFRLANGRDVAFGYWGDEDLLARVKTALPAGDEKTERFLSLGRATWQEVLSLSPAEPGLSPLKFFSHGNRNYVSAGGWSDLHPVRILKAAGCESVVYITRRGGESLFAQGVAKRLMGDEYGRDWKYLTTKPKANLDANTVVNNKGDSSDTNSLWSRLYNLANPRSSFRLALDSADAVLCTNWNAFNIKEGTRAMIADSYTSPFYVPVASSLSAKEKLTPRLDKNEMVEAGYPKYAGCF